MFDIGFSELLLIAVVALVVLGPERLPKAARFAGLWVRRARNQWDSVKQELERELHAEEIKRNLQDVRQSMQQAETELRDQARQVQTGADEFKREVEQGAADEAVIEPTPVTPKAIEAEAGDAPPAAAQPAETPADVPGPQAELDLEPVNRAIPFDDLPTPVAQPDTPGGTRHE